MTNKLSPIPAFPSLTDASQSYSVMGWAQQLVASLMREWASMTTRSNLLLAGDGTEIATAPVKLASYTVAGLPSAATFAQGIIYVSNGTTNHRLAVSDGTNWRWPDGVIVS